MGGAPKPAIGSAFWQAQADRFAALREELRKQSKLLLGASYHPDGWGFDGGPAFRGKCAGRWLLDHGTETTMEEFKGIAGICAVALGHANTDAAWSVWLDCVLRDPTASQPAELQVSHRVDEWRPEPDFEVVATGLLLEPLPRRPDPEPPIVAFEILEIDDVCGTSARACQRLADEATRAELTVASLGVVSRAEREGKPTESAPDPPADKSATLTPQQAADALQISETTLHRMRKRSEISMFKVGVQWRVLASEVMRVRQRPQLKKK